MKGLGQRQMARFARVSPSTVGKVEAGSLTPSLAVLERLLGAAGFYLVVVDQEGRVVQPMADRDDVHDGAGRRYPAHLDTILDPGPGEWWGGHLRAGATAGDLPPQLGGSRGAAST
jgi:transcriptional regulator with XRE-family HTH domain